MNHKYALSYGRVVLCPMSEEDNEVYRKLRNRNNVRIWFENSNSIGYDEQKRWYRNYLEAFGEFMFSVYNHNKQLVGGVSLYNLNSIEKSAEFGRLIIDKEIVTEKGLGTDATMAVLEIAKSQLFLKELNLKVYENNFAAISTYKKAGFVITEKISNQDGRNMFYMVRHLVTE